MSFDLPRSAEIQATRPHAPQPKHRRRIILRATALGLIVAAGLLVGASLAIDAVLRPDIERLEPAIGDPGTVVSIIGRHFGSSRSDSHIEVDGVAPTASSYLSWADSTIKVRFPVAVDSGLVHVITRHGRSNPRLFMNRARLPVRASGELAGRSGPYIAAFSAESGPVGSLLVISGLDFGENREGGSVLFPWAADSGVNPQLAQSGPSTVEGTEADLGNEFWSDKEIRLRVPDGAISGAVAVSTAKGRSNGIFFKVGDSPGAKTYGDPRSYSISQTVSITKVRASVPNELFLWTPLPSECASQRVAKILSQDPQPLVPAYRGTALFRFKDIQNGAELSVTQSYLVTVDSVITRVDPDRIVLKPQNPPALMAAYTAADDLVPAGAPPVLALSKRIVGSERNPWRVTKLVWDWMAKNIAYSPLRERAHAQDALLDKSADAYSYALLSCALLRAGGVAARPIAGYLVDPSRKAVRHYWLEVYIYGLGWVPLDPVLALGASPGGVSVAWDDRSRYFGSVDNRHLAFSHGYAVLAPMAPDGRRSSKQRRWSFQSFYEEASGGLEAYSSYWGDVEVTGLY
ncbi:MAG TPA: transglutaminase domain-containing protein [Rectinemataceae bacterium]|nr:transglutaminase domain-containing protein [Rectinemataceae bacterium]